MTGFCDDAVFNNFIVTLLTPEITSLRIAARLII